VSSSYKNKYRSIEIVRGPGVWATLGFVALAAFVQTTLGPVVAVHGVVPSFITIAVVLFALRTGITRGVIVGLVAGILEDALATGTGGAWTIATVLVALGAGRIARSFFSDGFTILSAIVAGGVLVRDLIFWLVMRIEGYPQGLGVAHAHAALYQAAATGVAAFIYLVIRTRFVVDATSVQRI